MASYIARRKFLATLGGTAAWSFAVHAQKPERIGRVGVLIPLAAAARREKPDVRHEAP
jgi:hypothetical protein